MTFPEVLAMERDAGLFFGQWEAAPTARGIHFSLRAPGMPAMEFGGVNAGGTSLAVESRLKMADWLEAFEDQGGKVVVQGCSYSDLRFFTRMFDLVVIAVGSGELGGLFDYDASRSGGAHAGRITQASLFGVEPNPDPAVRERGLEVVSVPGGGNIFIVPQLTVYGPATTIFAKGEIGEGLAWEDHERPRPGDPDAAQKRLDVLMGRLAQYAPDVAERCADSYLVDPNAVIMEEIKPQVRQPVAELPEGGMVLGMADAVITVDPVSGQLHTNSARCAQTYFDAIRAHGDRPFTADWGREAFTSFWNEWGRFAAMFTDVFVVNFWDESNRPPHFPALMEAVLTLPEIQDMWITGVCKPTELMWMLDETECLGRIAAAKARAGLA
jgi:hypothetical protein